MKKLLLFAMVMAGAAEAPMGRTTDWYAFGGDAMHDGWEKNEQRFTKDEVKDFRLLWQHGVYNRKEGVGAVLPPVVLGNLIGYRGFKELAFIAGSGNNLWSLDADLDRVYWEKHFSPMDVTPGSKLKTKRTCGGELSAAPALPGPVVFRAPVPGKPVPIKPSSSSAERMRRVRPVYLLTGDGLLRQLNQADGSELEKPRQFVPADVTAQPLTVMDDVVYTSTRAGCGHEAAIWSLDLNDPEAEVNSIKLGGDIAGAGGVVLDSQDRLLVQTENGPVDPLHGKYGGSLVALTKDLKVSEYFVMPDGTDKKPETASMNVTAPIAFVFQGVEMVVTTGWDGRLYLLKAADLGYGDHHHYISKSAVVPAMDKEKMHGIWNGLASWEDMDGSRYVLAPVWGPLSEELKALVPETKAPNGSIVVFKVEADPKSGLARLNPVWVSRDMDSPSIPVIAKGVVFALANGRFAHWDRGGVPIKKTHSTLYAFDGLTGKPMYSTADQVTLAGNLTGLSIANGRVYFVTVDNMVQAFGKYLER